MPQQDLSSEAHRLENISHGLFFQAYALLRGMIYGDEWADKPVSDLREACVLLEHTVARRLNIQQTTVVGVLVDANRLMAQGKYAQDEAE